MSGNDTDPRNVAARRLSAAGVRSVAMFEGAKGLIVLAAGFGFLSLIHRDIQAVFESVIRHLHLNPANRYPEIFIRVASRMDGHLGLLAAGAFAYACLLYTSPSPRDS